PDAVSRYNIYQVLEESRVHRHHVIEVAMDGALLLHDDLAVALNDCRFDLAELLLLEDLDWELAVQDALPDLRNAAVAQRIGFAGPAQLRLHLLVAFEQRLVGPFGCEGRVLLDSVELLKHDPPGARGEGNSFLSVLDRF